MCLASAFSLFADSAPFGLALFYFPATFPGAFAIVLANLRQASTPSLASITIGVQVSFSGPAIKDGMLAATW